MYTKIVNKNVFSGAKNPSGIIKCALHAVIREEIVFWA